MFVAVSILLLVDEAKVSLDDPVVKYIPEFEMKDQRYRDITVRMLFNHSSGLRDQVSSLDMSLKETPTGCCLRG